MSQSPTDPTNAPSARVIDVSAEVRRIWGPQWGRAPVSYEFSNGRKFYLQTPDSGIYQQVGYMVDDYIVDQPDYVRNEGQ